MGCNPHIEVCLQSRTRLYFWSERFVSVTSLGVCKYMVSILTSSDVLSSLSLELTDRHFKNPPDSPEHALPRNRISTD